MHTVNFLIHLVEHHRELVYFLLFIGLVFEGDFVLICAGIMAHLGALNFWFTFTFILLGGFGKTFFGYYLGTVIHDKWHDTKFLQYIEKKAESAMPHFRQKLFTSLFISKFIAGTNQFLILLAGYDRVDFKRYLKVEISSTLIWAPGVMLLGYFFSYTAFRISHDVSRFLLIVLTLLISYIVLDKVIGWAYGLFEELYDK